MLRQSITSANATHPLIQEGLNRADELTNYYLTQADIAASIETQKDLAEYNSTYQLRVKTNQTSLDILQVINKLAYLISFRQKLDQQFAILKPQIEPKTNLALVANGLEEIKLEQDKIDQNLDLITTQLTTYADQSYGRENAYSKITYSLGQIQYSERRIAERLIDFDKNYVDR